MSMFGNLFATRGPRRNAVVVCMGDYPGAGSDLNGPKTDVVTVNRLVTSLRGYTVRVLRDRKATPKRIRGELRKMIRGSRAGDSLFFYFSGHGTSIRDASGDEPDARDEALCGYGTSWDASLVLDDHLRTLLAKVPKGVSMFVMTDCCHSGTITRSLHSAMPVEQTQRVRFLPPPVGLGDNPAALAVRKRIALPEARMRHLLLSGCRPHEYSYETLIDGKVRGVLTHYFCEILRSNPNITYADLHRQLLKEVKKTGLQQHPQLEGPDAAKARKVLT